MKEGVLNRVVRDFGFIKLDSEDREVFVHKSDYPGLMTKGSRVRFEESVPDPAKDGKTHAQSVEILSRASTLAPIAPAFAVEAASAAILSNEKEDTLAVTWRHDDPIAQPNLILVRIWIIFLRLGSAVSGLVVSLHKVDQSGKRTKVVTPSPKATTDGKGEAYFALYLTPDVEFCDLVAIADGKEYPYTWSKTQPAAMQTAITPVVSVAPLALAAASPLPIPTTIEVEKSGPDANGVYSFRVVGVPNKDVTIGGNVAVEPQGPFTTDDQGRVEIKVRVRDKGAKGEINFRSEGLQSKPRYVASQLN